jgi:Rhodanese-related sulfurtransferase
VIKLKNSVFKLVKNEKININCVKIEETIKIHSNKMNMFVDIIDIIEITKSGRILGAKHVPRVILEFWKDTKSQHLRKFLNECFNFMFYCASDWRSLLTTLIANNIGLLNTSNLIGGYNKWLELSNPMEEAR